MTRDQLTKLEAALSREGKPRGDHMIEAYTMMAKMAEASGDEDQVALASVFDCASRCIAAENAMFEGLKRAVADLIEQVEPTNTGPDPRLTRLEDAVHGLATWAWGGEKADAVIGRRSRR